MKNKGFIQTPILIGIIIILAIVAIVGNISQTAPPPKPTSIEKPTFKEPTFKEPTFKEPTFKEGGRLTEEQKNSLRGVEKEIKPTTEGGRLTEEEINEILEKPKYPSLKDWWEKRRKEEREREINERLEGIEEGIQEIENKIEWWDLEKSQKSHHLFGEEPWESWEEPLETWERPLEWDLEKSQKRLENKIDRDLEKSQKNLLELFE